MQSYMIVGYQIYIRIFIYCISAETLRTSAKEGQTSYTIYLQSLRFFYSLGVGLPTCHCLVQNTILFSSMKHLFLITNNAHEIAIFSGDGEETEENIDRSNAAVNNAEEHGEQSHLIVWQVQCPFSMPVNGQPMNVSDESLVCSAALYVSTDPGITNYRIVDRASLRPGRAVLVAATNQCATYTQICLYK